MRQRLVSGPTHSGRPLSGWLADEHCEDADLLPEGVGPGHLRAKQNGAGYDEY